MIAEYEYAKKLMISRKEIESLEEENTVLVNLNRVYWQLSKLSRMKQNEGAVQTLFEKLYDITDEKVMYIPMKVKEIKVCFENGDKNLPVNTFRRTEKVSF